MHDLGLAGLELWELWVPLVMPFFVTVRRGRSLRFAFLH